MKSQLCVNTRVDELLTSAGADAMTGVTPASKLVRSVQLAQRLARSLVAPLDKARFGADVGSDFSLNEPMRSLKRYLELARTYLLRKVAMALSSRGRDKFRA